MNNPAPKTQKTAITPTRAENYAEWYQQIVRHADLAEASGVRGCMIMKPWGYGTWELMQREFDRRIKKTGHDNCYFPLFIPLSYFQREADHVEGFAKEMAVVTHHRLKKDKDGKLVPDGELEEPLIVRPTSEMVIGEAMSKWIKSYRDLPMLLNQWANVVRWEMRPRLLLRTTEFLWQEGHTAHETADDAMAETRKMLGEYADFARNYLALPVIDGEKPAHERFPGAVNSYTIEAMMQDGRALQGGTSHYLGQNFAKAIGIQFQSRAGNLEHVHTTSWGISTRLLGGMIMAHGDDNGMRMPPHVAPWQVVIVPIFREGEDAQKVMDYCDALKQKLEAMHFGTAPIRVKLDARDISGADKKWEWVKKGAPLLLEIGPRDVGEGKVCVIRRDKFQDGKKFIAQDIFVTEVVGELESIQKSLYDQAHAYMQARTEVNIKTLAEFEKYFGKEGEAGSFSVKTGFVRAKWSGDAASLAVLDNLGVTIRCIPFDQDGKTEPCVLTGKPATQTVIFARSY